MFCSLNLEFTPRTRQGFPLKNTAAVLSGAVLALFAFPALAGNYSECMKLVDMAPKRAYELATEWRDNGGGIPSEHCRALALFTLGDYEQAAGLLEELSRRAAQQARQPDAASLQQDEDGSPLPAPKPVPASLAADLLAQAGNAWLMAEQHEKAFAVLSDALAESGGDANRSAEILIDRARARVEMGNVEAAVSDLDQAIKLGGPSAEALAYRAAAHRARSAFASARADIDQALALDPQSPEALLESGNLNSSIGNLDAAIVDWLQVTKEAPDTPLAKAAAASITAARAQQEAEAKATTPPEPPAPSPAPAAPPASPKTAPAPAP